MKIITMATLKGGSGKTMNTFNIAGILAETKKVLLIDVDPQCNLSSNCGVNVADKDLKSVKDIFDNTPKNQPKLADVIYKAPIKELPNLDIIPSSIQLFRTEMNMASKSNREHILDNYIRVNVEYLDDYYDYVFIDTNPSMSIININAFFVADEIILSSDVSTNSISGAELFCALWDERREELYKEDNVSALILCNYDRRTNVAEDLYEFASEADFSSAILIETIIPTTVKLKDTELEHKPINVIHPKEEIKKVYDKVIAELVEREVL